MNDNYKGFKDSTKLHIAPHTVCVGKRDDQQLDISYDIDCAETLPNQYMSVVSSSDVARASLDEHCLKITNGACTNYNYFSTVTTETWTTNALTRNSYEVVYINNNTASGLMARKTAAYNWVIAFNGKEKFISGNGTQENPYVITAAS